MKIISQQMMEYFVSDHDLPIQVVQHPYFEYYLELLDPYYNCKQKYQMLLDALNIFDGNEDELRKKIKGFIDGFIFNINSNYQFIHFSKEFDMNEFKTNVPLSKTNIYNATNNGLRFASIDLVKANFQALKFVGHKIFNGHPTYESFVSEQTDIEYIKKSKKIRQIIFGNLCPSRQQTVQRYIISLLKEFLIEKGITDIRSTSSDEIVFVTPNSEKELQNILDSRPDTCAIKDVELKIKTFTLEQKGTLKYSFFVKRYDNGKQEIKGVDSAYLPEVIKYLENRPLTDYDRLFIRDNRLCRFEDSLFS